MLSQVSCTVAVGLQMPTFFMNVWGSQLEMTSFHTFSDQSHCCCRQVGFINFDPLKPMFLDVYTATHAALPTLPHLGPLAVALDRNWSSGDPVKPPQAPALVCACVNRTLADFLCATSCLHRKPYLIS